MNQPVGFQKSRRRGQSVKVEVQPGSPSTIKGFPTRWQPPGTEKLYVFDQLMLVAKAVADPYGVETRANHVCI